MIASKTLPAGVHGTDDERPGGKTNSIVITAAAALAKYSAADSERYRRIGLDLGVYRVDDIGWTSLIPRGV